MWYQRIAQDTDLKRRMNLKRIDISSEGCKKNKFFEKNLLQLEAKKIILEVNRKALRMKIARIKKVSIRNRRL